MSDPYFFGYGSLVNLATHDYGDPRPATLQGWRRLWCETSSRKAAFLSIAPAPGARIQGLMAQVKDGDWQALDAREAGYERREAAHQITHDLAQQVPCAVYTIPQSKTAEERPSPAPILLSYLDVVLQGFIQIYGELGARGFMDTTDQWNRPVLNDRAAPLYPRHQKLEDRQRQLVDALCKDYGLHLI